MHADAKSWSNGVTVQWRKWSKLSNADALSHRPVASETDNVVDGYAIFEPAY